MLKKIYTHTQAAKLAGSFLYEVCKQYNLYMENQNDTVNLFYNYNFTEKQAKGFYIVEEDVDYSFPFDWQISILRVGLCSDVSALESLLMTTNDILEVLYDFLEFEGISDLYEYSPFLVIFKRILNNEPLGAKEILIWKSVIDKYQNNPNDPTFNMYPYFDEIHHDNLPPEYELCRLTLSQKSLINEQINTYLAQNNQKI